MTGHRNDPLEMLRQQVERLRQTAQEARLLPHEMPRPARSVPTVPPRAVPPRAVPARAVPAQAVPDPAVPAPFLSATPAEEAELLRQLIDSSDAAIHAVDLQGRYLLANPTALRLLGQPLEAVLGQPREHFLQLRAALPSTQLDCQVASSGEPARLLEEFYGPDGLSQWMSHRFALRDADGRVLGVCAIARDLTHERDLQSQARLSEAVFHHSQEAILVFDTEGCIERVNPYFERLFGFSAASVLGRDFFLLFQGEAGEQVGQAVWQQVAERGQWSGELLLRSANGRERTCWASFARLSAEDAQFLGNMAVLTDLTELSQARSELLRHRDHLEELVVARTLELERARQAAVAADAAKSTFLSVVSHELRTPLNSIIGQAWLLGRSSLDSQQQEQLRELQDASQQLSTIINDLLQFVQLDADGALPPPGAFRPADLLSEVRSHQAVPADAKGLVLSVVVDPRLPPRLFGPADQIGLVLQRLLYNAVKFTERGAVTLGVREVGRTASQLQLEFEVRDTGIGMDAAVRQRLFQPFVQGEAVLTRQFGGLGLGLSIARRILDRLGGEIGVDSAPGQGSRFWFRLAVQLAPDDAAADAPAAIDAATLAQWPALRKQLEALLEDNDADAQALWLRHGPLLRAALGPHHAEIDAAMQQFNFEHALALIRGLE